MSAGIARRYLALPAHKLRLAADRVRRRLWPGLVTAPHAYCCRVYNKWKEETLRHDGAPKMRSTSWARAKRIADAVRRLKGRG